MRKLRLKNSISLIIAILAFCIILLKNNISVVAYDGVELILSETGEASPSIFQGGAPPIAPGSSISQSFSIKNNTNRNYNVVSFKLINFELVHDDSNMVTDTSLKNYFTNNVRIKLEEKAPLWWNTIIFDGTMNELLKNDGLKLDKNKISISKGGAKEFLITISMDELTDNRVQGIRASFGTDFSAVSQDGSSVSIGGAGVGVGGSIGSGGSASGEESIIDGKSTADGESPVGGESSIGGTGAGGDEDLGGSGTDTAAVNKTIGGSNFPTASVGVGASSGIAVLSKEVSNELSAAPAKDNEKVYSEDHPKAESIDDTNILESPASSNISEKTGDRNMPSRYIKTSSILDEEVLLASSIIFVCAVVVFVLKKNKA